MITSQNFVVDAGWVWRR